MIQPISKTLSKSIMDSIEVDKIIYAEIAQPGAMGNAGGIIMYIPQASLREIISYETSIFEDEETYSLAYEKLHDHS